MVSLIVTDAKHKPLRAVDDYTLDLAYGSDENSFKLTCLPQPEAGALIIIDGTEYGGLVTVRNTDGSVEGPTWHGLLSRRILQPDAGRDYLTVSGAAGDVLNMLFKRIGLDALFTASARHAVTIGSYSFDRYTDAYTGIRKMLAANNAKLRLIWADGRVNAYALPAEHSGGSIDSDLLEFKASLDSQPVNHLIGLGTGELKDRAVVHWYADVNGNVSQTQSLTGLAERQAVYDYSNAKPDELNTETRKKLIELQSQGGVEVTITDNTLSMDVGDTVTGRDNRLGITLTVPVAKKIVKSSGGILSVDYECGTASGDTTSLSGSAESNGSTGSGGSGTYYADGVTITMRNNTFSAVVTPSRVDDVEKTAKDAYTLASNYSAEIGKAQQDSIAAIATADKAGIVKPGGDFDITEDGTISLYKAMGINSFTVSPSQAERGSTVADVTVAWSLSKTPKSLTLDDKAQDTASKGTTLSGVNLKADKTYTLKATDARNAVATRTADVAFRDKRHWWVAASLDAAGVTDQIINQATGELAAWYNKTFTLNAAAGQHIYYAFPASWGTPRFFVGGFEGGFALLKTFDHKNASGATISYAVWKSTNAGLGNTTVEVK